MTHCNPYDIECALRKTNSTQVWSRLGGCWTAKGMAIAGVASSVDEALRQAEQLRPDVVLVDSDVRGESGLELVGGCTGWAVTARFR